MSRVFFTADHHFGHPGILKMCGRPFDNIVEHDRTLIENWNAVVGHDDVVWHLGDFGYKSSPKERRRIFGQLNGTKHLIFGNHDFSGGTQSLPWASQAHMADVTIDGQRLILCHYSLRTWPGMHHGAVQLYGHSHGRLPGTQQCIDVGVDNFNFTPATWPEIKARLALEPPMRLVDGTDAVEGLEVVARAVKP